jgi:hypothetical protein
MVYPLNNASSWARLLSKCHRVGFTRSAWKTRTGYHVENERAVRNYK